MKTAGFRFARHEEPVGFSGHTQLEEQNAVAWLVNLLNASMGQNGSDFAKHTFHFGGGECHMVRAFQNFVGNRAKAGAIVA